MPDRWKKVLAIIKTIIFFRFARNNLVCIKDKVCASQCSLIEYIVNFRVLTNSFTRIG